MQNTLKGTSHVVNIRKPSICTSTDVHMVVKVGQLPYWEQMGQNIGAVVVSVAVVIRTASDRAERRNGCRNVKELCCRVSSEANTQHVMRPEACLLSALVLLVVRLAWE